MAFDFKKEYKEFYLPKNKPQIVTVPPANYIRKCTAINKEIRFWQKILARMAFFCYNHNILKGLELKECALLLADRLGIQPKATCGPLGFAVPGKQEAGILSA